MDHKRGIKLSDQDKILLMAEILQNLLITYAEDNDVTNQSHWIFRATELLNEIRGVS